MEHVQLIEEQNISNRRNHICVAGTVVAFNMVMLSLMSYLVYQVDHTEAHIDEIYEMLKHMYNVTI